MINKEVICVKLFPEFNFGLEKGTKSILLKNGNLVYYNLIGLPVELEKCNDEFIPLKKK